MEEVPVGEAYVCYTLMYASGHRTLCGTFPNSIYYMGLRKGYITGRHQLPRKLDHSVATRKYARKAQRMRSSHAVKQDGLHNL
jgi:hypothetical protein